MSVRLNPNYHILCAFRHRHLCLFKFIAKLPTLLVLPVSYISLTFSLYLVTLVVANPIIVLSCSFLLCLGLSYLYRNQFATLSQDKPQLLFLAIALLVTTLLVLPRASILMSAE
jgi:hypothetical protein